MWGLRISLLRSATLCYFKSDVSDTRNTFASPTLPLKSTRSCVSAVKQPLLERFARLVLGQIRTLPPIVLLRAVPARGIRTCTVRAGASSLALGRAARPATSSHETFRTARFLWACAGRRSAARKIRARLRWLLLDSQAIQQCTRPLWDHTKAQPGSFQCNLGFTAYSSHGMIFSRRSAPRLTSLVRQASHAAAAQPTLAQPSFDSLASAITPAHGQVRRQCSVLITVKALGIVASLSGAKNVTNFPMQDLWEKGYTVIDGAFTAPTCQAFREEIEALRAKSLLHLNSTHLVKGDTRSLLQKHGIYEAEVADKVIFKSHT